MLPEICACCRFAKKSRSIDLRENLVCHRNPPVAYPAQTNGGLTIASVRPMVQPSDWCGQFERTVTIASATIDA